MPHQFSKINSSYFKQCVWLTVYINEPRDYKCVIEYFGTNPEFLGVKLVKCIYNTMDLGIVIYVNKPRDCKWVVDYSRTNPNEGNPRECDYHLISGSLNNYMVFYWEKIVETKHRWSSQSTVLYSVACRSQEVHEIILKDCKFMSSLIIYCLLTESANDVNNKNDFLSVCFL